MTEDRDMNSDIDPEEMARFTALQVASQESEVGEFITSQDIGDGVTDFRFKAHIPGYESWQWSVTLYHDVEADRWTVDESSLIPASGALLSPQWVPWKDRLVPEDFSVTDVMGTESDDKRLEDGFRKVDAAEAGSEAVETKETDAVAAHAAAQTVSSPDATDSPDASHAAVSSVAPDSDEPDAADAQSENAGSGGSDLASADSAAEDHESEHESSEDLQEAVDTLHLARRRVLSPLGRSEAAKRWYAGQGGPKSLSTKAAEGHTCDECGFYIPLSGELGTMFGVCANRWSPDDGRVVSLDHGCGEHSDINPPEMSPLWVQSEPAFDDLHIDIVKQAPREERPEVELIEKLQSDDKASPRASDESKQSD
ncbi:MAG: DUF3027 domain-containing protein [Bifidobacterium aquikefiri]|nr:DUF3027 domain-containing protein [Bifidobacterium aquikefiri]